MKRKQYFLISAGTAILLVATLINQLSAFAWTAVTVEDDHLVRMPGTQPGDLSLVDSSQCSNCHENFDEATEPTHNWRGSMMAQSMRDPLFTATMAIAIQDADSSGDLCLRCHTPTGWLSGRSDPPDGSALDDKEGDFTGVNCLALSQSS